MKKVFNIISNYNNTNLVLVFIIKYSLYIISNYNNNIISHQENTNENLNKISLYAFTRMAKTI